LLLDSAIFDAAPKRGGKQIALVMLPGAKNTPQQFLEYGFIHALRERDLAVDAMVLDAHEDYYLDRNDIEKLLLESFDAVKARGYQRIWFAGISLGGLGSILCTLRRRADVEGVLLLAPFLGTRGIVAEVAAAGGLAGLARQAESEDMEIRFLAELGAALVDENFPWIYLGYGLQDRFLGASELLAACLPPHRVLTIPGGHDWETWSRLWEGLLDKVPFTLPGNGKMS
jgi:pimeloyl-ACP methyl ester carboxylesterase